MSGFRRENALERIREDVVALEDFLELLRIPTVSTDSKYRDSMLKGASWVEQRLKTLGLQVERLETPTVPVIFAEYHVSKDLPTLLIYNHYDVQPPEPLEKWKSPPFEPEIRNGKVYARGAEDNKGQLCSVLAAIRMELLDHSTLPCNIKWLIEGEEESGSRGLAAILPKIAPQLKADGCVIIDVSLPSLRTPAVQLGARGIVTFTLRVRGSSTDLHSGLFGGIAYNPLKALVDVLSSLRNPDGSINIPGFYEGVQELPHDALKQLLPIDSDELLASFGCQATGGEIAFPLHVRNWLRPTLEINGIEGGYTGQGFKTVIPAEAVAKISCRLVLDQNPKKVALQVIEALKARFPSHMQAEIEVEGEGDPFMGDPKGPLTLAACKAMEEALGSPCYLTMSGGSLPICRALAEAAGASILAAGMGLPEDHIHSPNENFSITQLEHGILFFQRLLHAYGSLARPS